jgi:hypothetical protein
MVMVTRAFAAFTMGLRTAVDSPKLLAMLWGLLLLAAVPFGLAMQHEIQDAIGPSRVGQTLLERMDLVWLGEFREGSDGLRSTLQPATTSAVDLLHNLDLALGGRLVLQQRALVAAGLGYALLWLLLLGGLIDRYGRGEERPGLSQLLAAGGSNFLRLLALALLAASLYVGLFFAASWTFKKLGLALRDVTAEATVLQCYLAASALLLLILALVMLVFDYAKVAAVLEDEKNPLKALRRGFRFVTRRSFTVGGLAGLVATCALALIALRTLADPGTAESTVVGVVAVFLLGQLFLLGRIVLRLALVAGEVALYRTAHAQPAGVASDDATA